MSRFTLIALGVVAVTSLGLNVGTRGLARADTVIYQTGFEAPTYAIANLNGQDGWSVPALPAVVQHSPAVVGTQTAAFSAAGLPGAAFAAHALAYSSVSNAEPFVRVKADFFVGGAGTPTIDWTVLAVNGNAGFIGQIAIDGGNTAILGLASGVVGSVPITRGVWNHFELDLNFQTGVQTAYVNGIFIGQGPFSSTSTTLTLFQSGVNSSPGSDVAALDVVSVTSAGLGVCCQANTGVCTVLPFCPPGTSNSSVVSSACTPAVCVPACGTPAYSSPVNYLGIAQPHAVAVGDFNGDGRADLAIAGGGILLGSAGGTFAAPANSNAGSVPGLGVAVADVNRDGKLDVISADFQAGKVHLWLGNGDGSFQNVADFTAGTGPSAVAVADFNGDGKLDLAVANYVSGNVSILLGNGNGTFQTAVNYPAAGGAASIAIADFDGDGKLDIVTANFATNNISVLTGNGDGTFQAATNILVGSNPFSVVVGDFNGDGKPDLAVANFFNGAGGNTVSILLGTGAAGAAAFQTPVPYPAGISPEAIAVGDVNGDGKPDLAVANFGSANVSILLGLGNGTFQMATNYPAGAGPEGLAFGFFASDAMPDLAVANTNGGSTSILTNICMGACCNFITAACSITLQSVCGLASHTWTAAGVCTPNVCEVPGGCCDSNSACTRRTRSQCTAGLWTASVCTSTPCTLIGSCCNFITGSCAQTLITACGAASHTWTVGGACLPNPCQQTGSCCVLATGACHRATLGNCTGDTVVWTASGVCSPSPCPPPPGVCCNFVSGACAITIQSGCGLGSHTWTAGGSCTPTNPCPPIAACCDNTGACRRFTRERCLALSGTWVSEAVCTPNPCSPGFAAVVSCPADFNHSGTVDSSDVFDFLNAWLSQNPTADFDGQNGVDIQDIFAYLNAWFGGC
jgi:hypothetical protein